MVATCPNCGSAAPLDYLISIGCIVRFVNKLDSEHQRLFSKSRLDIDLRLSDLPAEFFSEDKSNWTRLPQLLQTLHYEYDQLSSHKALMNKDVRVCANCYDTYADSEEESRQREKAIKPNPPAQFAATSRLPDFSKLPLWLQPAKCADRTKDLAFTELQVTQRKSEALRQIKRDTRQRFVLDNLQSVDWSSSEAAAKQVKRITSAASARPATTEESGTSPKKLLLALVKSSDGSSPRRSSKPDDAAAAAIGFSTPASAYQIAPYVAQQLHTSRPHTAATAGAAPASVLPLAPSSDELESELSQTEPSMPLTAFDIPFHHRLMFDLWDAMRRECKFGAEDAFLPSPPTTADALFPVYRRNANRFPTPPVLDVILATPAASDDNDAVSRMDDYFPAHVRKLALQCTTSQVGLLLDLDAAENDLLAEVMQDDNIKMALGSDLDDDEAVSVDDDEDDDENYDATFDT